MTDYDKSRTWLWITEHGTDGVPPWEVNEAIAWFVNELNSRLRRENKEDQNEHQRT